VVAHATTDFALTIRVMPAALATRSCSQTEPHASSQPPPHPSWNVRKNGPLLLRCVPSRHILNALSVTPRIVRSLRVVCRWTDGSLQQARCSTSTEISTTSSAMRVSYSLRNPVGCVLVTRSGCVDYSMKMQGRFPPATLILPTNRFGLPATQEPSSLVWVYRNEAF
jgi:hypothetical protein